MKTIQVQPVTAVATALTIGTAVILMGQTSDHAPHFTLEQAEILRHMSIVYLDDGFGNRVKTIRISKVNVQVVNGLDDTETINGAGNLIVGYNEFGNDNGDDRTGSHNMVGGSQSSYISFCGLVVGLGYTVSV